MAHQRQQTPPVSAEAGPPTQTSAPIPAVPVAYPAAPVVKCSIEIAPEGTYARVLLEPHIEKRLRSRAHTQDLGDYLWANVFRAALESSVY